MCLTRGLGGLCPCTRCLIPKADLASYTIAELRTPQLAVEVLAWANAASTIAEKEEILKGHSLRPVFVCTSCIESTSTNFNL